MNKIRSQILGGEREERRALIGAKRPRGAKADALTSIAVSREVVRKSDTRDEDRHRLIGEQLQLTHEGRTYDVELINLSGGGAMVSGEFVPNLWDHVLLHFAKDATLECVVRWVKDDRVGIEFAHETKIDCPPEQRAKMLRDVIARSFPDVELELSVKAPEAKSVPAAAHSDEHRNDRRHPLIWSGVLHHDYQSTPVRLRNISERGAMIECSVPLPVGAEPLLDLGDAGSLFATVTWRIGDQAGLKFNEPFDLKQLARSRPEIAPLWANGAPAAGRASSGSAWANEWDRMSLSELREEMEGWLKR